MQQHQSESKVRFKETVTVQHFLSQNVRADPDPCCYFFPLAHTKSWRMQDHVSVPQRLAYVGLVQRHTDFLEPG